MEDFSLRLQTLISKLRSHGVTMDKEEAVSKYLHSVPAKYIQIALSIETMLDLSTLTIEDVTGHLRWWTSAWSRPQQRRTAASYC